MPRTDLPDAEAFALHAELKRLVEEKEAEQRRAGVRVGGKRAIGRAMGFPTETASQVVESALKRGRVGEQVANGLYRYLGVTREEFLRAKGLPLGTSIAERVLRLATGTTLVADELIALVDDFEARPSVDDDEIRKRILLSGHARVRVSPGSANSGARSGPSPRAPREHSQAAEADDASRGGRAGAPSKRA